MNRLVTSTCTLGLFFVACGVPLDSETSEGGGLGSGDGDGDAFVGGDPEGSGGLDSAGSGGTNSGGEMGDGDAPDSGGTGSGGAPSGPVAGLFEHCDYGGYGVELSLGDYTTADLVALGALDNDVSSVQVSPGYEVVLFGEDGFSGSSVTITSDTSCTVALSFNDLTSSVRVQAASGGTGGNAGTGGSDNLGEEGVTSCQPAFETACKPNIVFDNQHAEGGGALFDELFPDIESEMKDIACTVCSILYRSPDEIPQNKRHSTINLTIDAHDGVAYASGNSITISVNHLQNYTNPSSAFIEFRGVMVHETAHLYQHYGNGGTGEGMADNVRIRVGLYSPGRCNPGGSWRDAYTTSGCFYSWLTGPSSYHENHHPSADPNLPYAINGVLAGTSGEGAYTAVANLLLATFGQDVDALWTAYQNDL